jgi:hypothetical protein
MPKNYFSTRRGFDIDGDIQIITASGLPGSAGDSTLVDPGSLYTDLNGLGVHFKTTTGSGLSNWEQLALNSSLLANSSAIAVIQTSAFFGSVINDLSDVNAPTPADLQVIQFNASAGEWQAGNAGTGITLAFEWRFSTDTDTGVDPGNGRFRYNNASPILVTDIALDDEARSGFDVGNIIGILKSGDRLYVQQKDTASNAQLFEVTGSATDSVGYWNIPVSAQQVGSLPGNNKDCSLVFIFSGVAAAPDHGSLLGLADDDHPQYHDGSLAYTADLNMGGFNVSNVGLVDGVNVSAHAASTLIHFTSADYNMFMENPRVPDDIYFFFTKAEIDVQKVVFVIVGGSSVTAFISFGSNRDNLSTDLINAGTVVTNTTSGQVITSFDNAVIPVNNFVGVRITATAAPFPDQLNIHLEN